MFTQTVKQTITVPEAARILGIGRNLAYQMVLEGKLPSLRFGKRVVIPREALKKLLENVIKETNDDLQAKKGAPGGAPVLRAI